MKNKKLKLAGIGLLGLIASINAQNDSVLVRKILSPIYLISSAQKDEIIDRDTAKKIIYRRFYTLENSTDVFSTITIYNFKPYKILNYKDILILENSLSKEIFLDDGLKGKTGKSSRIDINLPISTDNKKYIEYLKKFEIKIIYSPEKF